MKWGYEIFNMKCWNLAFNAQGWKVIIVVVQIGVAKIYALEVHRKNERQDETQHLDIFSDAENKNADQKEKDRVLECNKGWSLFYFNWKPYCFKQIKTMWRFFFFLKSYMCPSHWKFEIK